MSPSTIFGAVWPRITREMAAFSTDSVVASVYAHKRRTLLKQAVLGAGDLVSLLLERRSAALEWLRRSGTVGVIYSAAARRHILTGVLYPDGSIVAPLKKSDCLTLRGVLLPDPEKPVGP